MAPALSVGSNAPATPTSLCDYGPDEAPIPANIHAVMLLRATDGRVGSVRACVYLLVSLTMMVVPIIALNVVALESSVNLRCTEHSHCRLGEWCSPQWQPPYLANPGRCADCNWPYEYNSSTDAYALAVDRSYVAAGIAHCAATDALPSECDHIVENQKRIGAPMVFLLLVVGLVVSLMVVVDAEQARLERALLDYQSRALHSPALRAALQVYSGLAILLRCYVQPATLWGASASLLLSGPLTCQAVLLNGVAVGFITQLDDALALVVRPPPRSVAERLQDQLRKRAAKGGSRAAAQAEYIWMGDVVHALCLGLVFVLSVVGRPYTTGLFSALYTHSAEGSGVEGAANCTPRSMLALLDPVCVSTLASVPLTLMELRLAWMREQIISSDAEEARFRDRGQGMATAGAGALLTPPAVFGVCYGLNYWLKR